MTSPSAPLSWCNLGSRSLEGGAHLAIFPPVLSSGILRFDLSGALEYALHPPVLTVADVCRVLRIPAADVLKSLVLEAPGGSLLVASLPGDRVLDLGALLRETGLRRLRLLSPSAIRGRLDVPVGALSPLTTCELPQCFDLSLQQGSVLHLGAGVNHASLRLSVSRLAELPGVRWAHISRARRD